MRRGRAAWLIVSSLLLASGVAHATANYVYHERTGGTPGGTCGVYAGPLAPAAAVAETVRWKIEYQFYTNQTRVYYTTDGTPPGGALGVGTGTTQVLTGAFGCTYADGFGNTVDVANASLPAQAIGATVRYVVSAWHSAAGPEIFANSGTCSTCTPCSAATCANVFSYTVGGADGGADAGGADLAASDLSLAMDDAGAADLARHDLARPHDLAGGRDHGAGCGCALGGRVPERGLLFACAVVACVSAARIRRRHL